MELIQNILVTALLGIWACLSIGFFVWLVQGISNDHKREKLEKEQAEHRIQRSLNYLDTQKKKKRKARTHLLIQKGAAIEAICKDTKYLTEAEFYQLMDELLHDPACKFCDVVHEMVRGRAETAEVKERELAEEEALLKAMKRGELPQGDE